MKQFPKLLGCLRAVLLFGNTYAQEDSIKTLPPVTVKSGVNVSEKVQEAFATDFKNAVDPKWYQINKNYLVKFISEVSSIIPFIRKTGIWSMTSAMAKRITCRTPLGS